jgi:hypothetical protein
MAAARSPSLVSHPDEACQAFELKFLVAPAVAEQIATWATGEMEVDPHANPTTGSYTIHTVYLDTPGYDMFWRREGYRNEKYRLRRYGEATQLFLEHKVRRGDRVAKDRCELPRDEFAAWVHSPGGDTPAVLAYRQTLAAKQLHPVCRMSYQRQAWLRGGAEGVVRLTLDQHIRGMLCTAWDNEPVSHGLTILPDSVVCEFKFRHALPQPFRQLVAELQLAPTAVSKYRRFMQVALPQQCGDPSHA